MIPEKSPVLIGEVLNQAADRMEAAGLCFGHGTDNAWDEACLLLFAVLNLSPDIDSSITQEVFPEEKLARFSQLLDQRIARRIPMAYLIGKTWYGGYPFVVNQDVLIPRSPLAELITARFQPWLRVEPRRILDLCAGSGCLGILCAHQFETAEVVLGELSPRALQVAQRNIALHQLEDRIVAVESDLFDALPRKKFDLIISNPPYVDARDIDEMPTEFCHEPMLGLASGADGLDITRRILAQAGEWLTERGLLVVEVGNSWDALEAAYPDVPFTWIELEHGGQGIFALERDELRQLSDSPTDAYNRGADQEG